MLVVWNGTIKLTKEPMPEPGSKNIFCVSTCTVSDTRPCQGSLLLTKPHIHRTYATKEPMPEPGSKNMFCVSTCTGDVICVSTWYGVIYTALSGLFTTDKIGSFTTDKGELGRFTTDKGVLGRFTTDKGVLGRFTTDTEAHGRGRCGGAASWPRDE